MLKQKQFKITQIAVTFFVVYLVFRNIDIKSTLVHLQVVPIWYPVLLFCFGILFGTLGRIRLGILLFDFFDYSKIFKLYLTTLKSSFYSSVFQNTLATEITKFTYSSLAFKDISKSKIATAVFIDRLIGLFEHFEDTQKIIQEQICITKKKGHILIYVPQKYNLYTLVKTCRMLNRSYPFGWETQYSLSELKNIGQKHCLEYVLGYGLDSAFTIKLPAKIRGLWLKIVKFWEQTPMTKYTCLCVGVFF